MKHLKPELDILTNADVPARKSADSVVEAVGVVTTADGADKEGDLVLLSNGGTVAFPCSM